jgi:peptidoglycan/xylan/chitin deacetylase (PgdA/CDA1 family)
VVLIIAAIGMGAFALAHIAPFPFILDALRGDRSIWHMPADPAAPTVYLTFDDGPNPTATGLLLDVLAQERAAATFFLIDAHVTEETAPLVRRMFDEGHAVALHSDARWLMLGTVDQIATRLQAAADRIQTLAGSLPCALFRPHAGWRSGAMYAALDRSGYRLVGWTWGRWDWNWWKSREGASLANRLAGRARAGDIIVMHDGHHIDARADRRYAVQATALLVPMLRARTFQLSPLPCARPAP